MMIATFLFLIGTVCDLSNDNQLHPAFVKTYDQMQSVWDLAESESKFKSNLEKRLNSTRRSIGTFRANLFESKGASFVWYLAPEFLIYNESFEAKRQYKPIADVFVRKKELMPVIRHSYGSISFYGAITLMPMFGSLDGSITRRADPSELKDVAVVLRVGDNILQPEGGQPGNLLERTGESLSIYALPRYIYSTTNTTTSVNAFGSAGYVYGTGQSKSSTLSSYVEYKQESYSWYQGDFIVSFRIIDDEGVPIITKEDEVMELIVIYGESERIARYNLKELEFPYSRI